MKSKWYVVWAGRVPGVYTSWDRAREQVDGYPNARYKGFDSRDEAYRAFREQMSPRPQKHPETRQGFKNTVKMATSEHVGSTLILHMQLSLDQLVIKLRAFRRENPDWKSPDLKDWKYKPLKGGKLL